MKLGVFTVLLASKTLEETLEYLSSIGVQMVELGTGGYPGNSHANPDILLNDEAALDKFKKLFPKYNIEISALSCHGNPVHPNKEIAESFHEDYIKTILLAEKLGIDQINTFSGCPGDHAGAKYPNWVTCQWPEDFTKILEYQWNDVLIPYWKDAVKFAKSHGVNKIALEMHPGFSVYNTASLLKLRKAVGDEIGANFDPSHLLWQGMDPVASIKKLKGAIFHFHAKDTYIDPYNTAVNGVLDTGSYANVADRSWVFRTVGYGQDTNKWKEMMSALRISGYDYAISIEHEDALMSVKEGLEKAVTFLQDVIIEEDTTGMWWA